MSGVWRWLLRTKLGRTLVAAAAFLLPAAAYVFYLRNAESARIEAAWKLSDAAGLPRTMDELLGPEIPFDENAAIPLSDAGRRAVVWYADFVQSHPYDANAESGKYLLRAAAFLAPKAEADAEYERSLDRADRLSRYRSRVPSLVEYIHPNISLPPEIANLGAIFHVERARALTESEQGWHERSVQRRLRILRLVEKAAWHEPLQFAYSLFGNLRNMLLGDLSEALYASRLADSTHDDIDAALARLENCSREMQRVMQAEKIAFVEHYPAVPPKFKRSAWIMVEGDDLSWGLAKAWEVQQAIDLPRATALPKQKRIKEDAETRPPRLMPGWGRLSASQLVGPLLNLRVSRDGLEAQSRAARILNALARKRAWTAPLESLGLPPHVLIDPYTDKPMRVKQTPAGPIVYSIGANLIDEDGEDSLPGAARPFGDIGLRPRAPQAAEKR